MAAERHQQAQQAVIEAQRGDPAYHQALNFPQQNGTPIPIPVAPLFPVVNTYGIAPVSACHVRYNMCMCCVMSSTCEQLHVILMFHVMSCECIVVMMFFHVHVRLPLSVILVN